MSSTPFSIRLPRKLVDIIELFAQRVGMSTSDSVRHVLEQSMSSEYCGLVIKALSDPREPINRVRTYLKSKGKSTAPALSDYSALMHFWHRAYMSGEGYANPAYVSDLLDMTLVLLTASERLGIHSEHTYKTYLRGKLDIAEDESFASGIEKTKQKFIASPSVFWAEVLTRPLEIMADDLQYLNKNTIEEAFSRHRLEKVFPVAVLGAKTAVDDAVIDQDMEDLLPPSMQMNVNGVSLKLNASPLTLVTEDNHSCYAFKTASVLSFATAISCGAFEKILFCLDEVNLEMNGHGPTASYNGGTLEVNRARGLVLVHEHGGYRLLFSPVEFAEIVAKLQETFETSAWAWLLNRHRELRGDR